jgi:hypothetical protein
MRNFLFLLIMALASFITASPAPQQLSTPDGEPASCQNFNGDAPFSTDVQAAANQLKALGSTACVASTNTFWGTCATMAHSGTAYIHGCGTGADTCESIGWLIEGLIPTCQKFISGSWRFSIYQGFPSAPDAKVWVTYH